MSEPKVSCIMLTFGRAQMAVQCMRAFESQSYENKELIIYDTGCEDEAHSIQHLHTNITVFQRRGHRGKPIGELRNLANACAAGEILCHFDDDDLSHPSRIAEQVGLLQSSEAEVAGYREVVFWAVERQEAWVYTDRRPTAPIGSSLMYWRRAWEQRGFDPKAPRIMGATSEYYEFLKAHKTVAVTSLTDIEPRLLCRIHAGNSADYSGIWNARVKQTAYRRAASFDDYCREAFGR